MGRSILRTIFDRARSQIESSRASGSVGGASSNEILVRCVSLRPPTGLTWPAALGRLRVVADLDSPYVTMRKRTTTPCGALTAPASDETDRVTYKARGCLAGTTLRQVGFPPERLEHPR